MQKVNLLLIVGCLSLVSASQALAHGDEHGELIIRMTENGFEPRELTITTGDEVTFINNDNADHWPASNFHPTHTLYSEFDALKGIVPGESWKFKFEKAGTWRMHDHLIPHFTGAIVVLENSSTDLAVEPPSPPSPGLWSRIKAFFSKFFSFSSKRESVFNDKSLSVFKNLNERDKYKWLEERAALENPEAAWRYVKAAYDTPEGVVGNPHDLAHLTGQLIYKAYGFDGLSICDPIFAFGCYHGLMEVAFNKDKPEEYADKLLAAQDGCEMLGNIDSPSYWSCIHGIGHGTATFREHDINKSLTDCDLLDGKIRTYCHDGVFMEFSISAPPSFYSRKNPVYPCDIVAETYKTSCARSQVQVMRLRFGMNTDEIAGTCIGTENSKIIYHCVDALGYFIGQGAAGRSENVIRDCREIRNRAAAAQCAAAAAGELVFQDYAGWRESVQEICSSLTEPEQAACQERVEQVKKSYGRN